MTNFRVDLKMLNECNTDLSNNKKNFSSLYNQVFTKLNKVNKFWVDHNTEPFLRKLKEDKEKIDTYSQKISKTNAAILNFTNSLISIARNCNAPSNGFFSYDGSRAKSLKSNCQTASSFIYNAKSKFNYLNIPSTYRYSYQLRNMKYKLNDIYEQVKKITSDVSGNINAIESAYNKIATVQSVEEFALTPLEYTSSIQSATLKTSDYVENAKNKENLMARNQKTKYEESESNFINQINLTSSNSSPLIYEEENSNFQNTSQIHSVNTSKNNYEESDSNFINSSNISSSNPTSVNFKEEGNNFTNVTNKVNYQNKTNEFKENNFNINLNSNKTDTTKESISFTKNNSNVNMPNGSKATENSINANVNSNISVETSTSKANNNVIDFVNTEH